MYRPHELKRQASERSGGRRDVEVCPTSLCEKERRQGKGKKKVSGGNCRNRVWQKGKSGRRNVKVLAVLSRELGGDPLLLFPIYEKERRGEGSW